MIQVSCLAVTICLMLLYFIRAKREWGEREELKNTYGNNFFIPGVYLLVKRLRKIFSFHMKKEKYEELRRIYVGEEEAELCCIYYTKMGAMMAGILLGGLLLLTVSCFMKDNTNLIKSYYMERHGVTEGDRNVSLEADNGTEKKEITVTIPRREYTQEQREKAFWKVRKKLLDALPGENISTEKVDKPLVLLTEVPGYAIDITWELGNQGLINEDGSLCNDKLKEPTQTEIIAILSYGEIEKRVVQMLTIYPARQSASQRFWTSWETIWKELEESARTEKYVQLPRKVAGKIMTYQEKEDSFFTYILAGIGVLILLVPVLYQRRMREESNKRMEQLRRDYPEFVEHFVLLIGAGLTVKSTWEKIVRDYEARQGTPHFVYEEMKLSLREMDCGMSETKAYELFGKRTGLLVYMKFCTLIVQNLRKGSSDLLHLLDYEVANAFHQRKESARELGEKAGTKLLLPMVVMLALVFVIILYASFQSM